LNSIDIAALCLGKRVLDIGCGRNKFPGAEGIDFAANSMADVRHDLNVFPYPLPESRYEAILLRNVIEHLQDVVRLMEEVHRVGKPGADVIITTPHFSSLYSYQDPTHIRHLALDSMDYFTEDTKHSNFYSDRRFRIVGRGLDFGKSFPFSPIAKGLFTLSARNYEKHFAFIFPANSLWFHLQAVK
jgi:SAM-dependent methyltransferase